MKHLNLLIIGVLLAVGSLLIGLQLGKAKLAVVDKDTPQINAETKMGSELISTTTETSSAEIALLKEEIKQLKSQLAQKDSLIQSMQSSMGLLEQQVEMAYQDVEVEPAEGTSGFDGQDDQFYTLSLEEAEQYIPAPFASVIAEQSGELVKLFQRHHQDEVDYDWATQEELKLHEMIANQIDSHNIKVDSVSCKKNTCEIRAYELAPQAWFSVSAAFQQANLTDNVSSWSTLTGSEEEALIYMINEYNRNTDEIESEQ
ncbi:hypothetical protein [Shewanella gaetbuli]